MKLLLHMCCGPCTTYSQKHFRNQGYDLHGYFYNPNIHPYREFAERLLTLEGFCQSERIPLTVRKDYDLEDYLRGALNNMSLRCQTCYRLRLGETAKEAAARGIPCFSTTLAISPYQNHELLCREGESAGKQHGVKFVYEDLRPGYRESVAKAKELGLYRQGYCGCIFSEKERYRPKGGI